MARAMDDKSESVRYLDRCERCTRQRVIVPPFQVRPSDIGSGVVADYLCPAGHTWFTSWGPGEDDQAA